MNFRQTQFSRAVSAAKDFFVTYASKLPRTLASGAKAQLDQLADGLQAAADQQDTKARDLREGLNERTTLKVALFRDHLEPIAAAALVKLDDQPDLSGVFTLPKKSAGIARVVTAANGIADKATQHVDRLVGIGLAPDFIDQLRAATAAFSASGTSAVAHKGGRKQATSTIRVSGSQISAVFKALDRLVRSELRSDAPTLDVWNGVKGMLSTRRSVTQVAPPATPAVPAAAPVTPEVIKPTT